MLKTLLLASTLLIAAPAAAQDLTPAEAAQIDTIVTQNLAKAGVPSAQIAVVRDGRIVLAKAYGKASDAIPVATPGLPYQIASISKQFTAAAILLLQREGKLSLNDTVSKWLPGISGGDTITIRQLLSHTAGLQDYWPQDYSFAAMEKPTTPQAILDRWAKKPLDFAPGTAWQYSNTGYVAAGMIAEKAAGEPLLSYLQRKVFTPLGMTSVMDQDKAVGKKYPVGYHRYALGPVRAEGAPASGWLFAAGELSMSATDLAKWDIARINRTILTPEEWATQETLIKLNDGTSTGYGLGVDVGQFNGHKMIEHGGEAVGFLSENYVFPDDKMAVVVLTNSDFSNAFVAIGQGINGLLLPAAVAAPSEDQIVSTAKARAIFDQLRTGTLDRSKLTEDANYYFNATALGDYQSTLAALGEPKSFESTRKPRLRGGFVNRNFKVTYADRTLNVVTYAEPGENGRYEQFLVMPAN